MALTAEDLNSIKHLFDDRFDAIQNDIELLARATKEQFEDLEQRIDQRFEQIDQRFEEVDRRFEQIDQRLSKMDQRFDAMDRRMDAMDKRFDAIDKRFDKMDKRFDKLEDQNTKAANDLGVIKEMTKDHSFRIKRLEHHVKIT